VAYRSSRDDDQQRGQRTTTGSREAAVDRRDARSVIIGPLATLQQTDERPARFEGAFFAVVVAPVIALVTIAALFVGGVIIWAAFAGMVIAPIVTFLRTTARGISDQRVVALSALSAMIMFVLLAAFMLAIALAYSAVMADFN